MRSLLRPLAAAVGRRLRPRRDVEVEDAAHLLELCHWADRPLPRLHLPTHLLRMQGAYAYGPAHPFVRGLLHGQAALQAFYDHVRPVDVADWYGLPRRGLAGEDLPPWELPWYLRARRSPPPGEGPLGPEHGVSFHGPVTAEKCAYEMSRLTGLRDSIARQGYDPDAYGDIEGYVLRQGSRAVFFVRGGKHRAAALAALGKTRIPAGFRTTFPRLVDGAQVGFWPLVRSGVMAEALASDLLDVYIRGSGAGTEDAA